MLRLPKQTPGTKEPGDLKSQGRLRGGGGWEGLGSNRRQCDPHIHITTRWPNLSWDQFWRDHLIHRCLAQDWLYFPDTVTSWWYEVFNVSLYLLKREFVLASFALSIVSRCYGKYIMSFRELRASSVVYKSNELYLNRNNIENDAVGHFVCHTFDWDSSMKEDGDSWHLHNEWATIIVMRKSTFFNLVCETLGSLNSMFREIYNSLLFSDRLYVNKAVSKGSLP